ncbi:hypothetical protein WH47_06074, partial [Habropoda laboriosa]
RSSDLSPQDFYLWEHLHVYETPVNTIGKFRDPIILPCGTVDSGSLFASTRRNLI